MNPVKTAVFEKSSSKIEECPPPKMPEYAFIGRSNVGKSSLINHITGNRKLAKTSGKPGKTQLINHFLIDDQWYLVDLPGYGWAQVSKTEKAKWKKMIDRYLRERENLALVFLLIDSRHEPQKVDMEFMRWLGQNAIPFILVYTKVDKQSRNQTESNIARYRKILKKDWAELPKYFTASNVTGEGLEIIDYVRQLNEDLH